MKRVSMSILAAGCSLVFAAAGLAQMGSPERQSPPPPGQASPSEQQDQQIQQQQRQQQQQAQQQKGDQYARQLMEPDKFKEMKVQDAQGEEIGTVEKVILDAKEGKIGYIAVQTGGTLGMGGETSIIPWSAVQYREPGQQPPPSAQGEQVQQGQQRQEQQQERQESQGEPFLMVNASKDQLMSAPQSEIQELDRKHAELIHQYYGVSPYWEESQGEQQQPQGQQPMQPMQQPSQQPMQQPQPQQPQ